MSDIVGNVIPNQNTKQLLQMVVEDSAKVRRLRCELKNCRNELCLKCGNYHESYAGACDGCRYRHGGEWEVDLHE